MCVLPVVWNTLQNLQPTVNLMCHDTYRGGIFPNILTLIGVYVSTDMALKLQGNKATFFGDWPAFSVV